VRFATDLGFRLAVALCWLSSVLTVSLPGRAMTATRSQRQLTWQRDWPRFSPAEFALTGSLLLGTGVLLVTDTGDEPNWRGPVLFDESVRDVLRGGTPATREAAQTASDAFYYAGLAYPYLVDVVAVAWLTRESPDVAGQMALIDTEAFAVTGFLSFLSNATLKRERPSRRECSAGKPDPIFPACDDSGPSEAFYSGHTGIAFTGAGLICMHHAHLALYGSGPGGTITCAASLAGATLGGALRVVADQHYASDVIAGGAIGLAFGLVVPWLHYGPAASGADATATAVVASWSARPTFSSTSAALVLDGRF